MEDYAIILDFLPLGYVDEGTTTYKRKPVAQAIGTEEFTLLELSPKDGIAHNILQKMYIGAGKRDEISRVNRRIPYEKLTSTAKIELSYIREEIVKEKEDKFVHFFNESGPISLRLHQIELLPGIGKKHMADILEARKKGPFKSFDDIKKRVPMISDPMKLISKRIVMELESHEAKGKRKYVIFTRPPKRKPQP